MRIAEGDEAKTTIVTRYGSFEFMVMPFSLTNAPTTFCNQMINVLYNYLDKFVIVYLDDMVIYSESLDDHVGHLRLVFSRLREHKLYVKKEKCEFCRQQITILGHVISQGKVMMDKWKVETILDWPILTKVVELQLFLGLANYYKWFIKSYSKIIAPLTDLLKKGQPWHWHTNQDLAF